MSFCTLRCYSYVEAGISVFCRTEVKQIEKQYDAITVPRFTDSAQPCKNLHWQFEVEYVPLHFCILSLYNW